MKRTKRTLSLLVALAMVLLSATTAFAGTYSIFGDDNRTSVSTTSGTNYSICKIEITYDTGAVEYGTGFLISSTKVITAGHVLHYKNKTAKKLKLYFGCTGTKKANEIIEMDCTSENIYYSSSWANNHTVATDYGAIKLPKEVTGPTNFFTLKPAGSLTGKDITITGYEATEIVTGFTDWQLLQGKGTITSQNSSGSMLRTRTDALPGQSGSPVVYGGNVIGIYTSSADGGYFFDEPTTEANYITGITDDVKTALEKF